MPTERLQSFTALIFEVLMSRILENQKLSKRQKRERRNRILGAAVVLVVVLLAVAYWLFVSSGSWLVKDDAFKKVTWLAVLEGQSNNMERTDYAAKLLASGVADSAVIFGRRVFRDYSSADFYVADMFRAGDLDSTRIFPFTHDDPSTLEEALSIIPWFKARNADTVLLVTSASATRRASKIFNTLSGGKPTFITTDIRHYSYNPETWLGERESRKLWVREVLAYLQMEYELFGVEPLEVDPKRLPLLRSVKQLRDDEQPALIPLESLNSSSSMAASSSSEILSGPSSSEGSSSEVKHE